MEQLQQWIKEAEFALTKHKVAINPKTFASDVGIIIMHESSGNPNAINNWDENAKEGHPSKGLMQVIQPTFEEYKLPEHDNIDNPVDNIIAGVRYAVAAYGSLDNVPGVKAVKAGKSYVGY